MKYIKRFGLLFFIYIISNFFIFLAIADDKMVNSKATISRINLKLTSAEKKWLQDHQIIKIAGPKSFPPFHYFEKSGTLRGMSADYIYTIMNHLGVKIEVQEKLPWPEVLKRAKAKEIDLIPCVARTVERESYLSFSNPYLSFPLVIVTRKNSPFIGGIEDLHGKKLAIIQKNSTVEWLKRDEIYFIPHYVKSPLKGLEAVSLGRADANIENLAAAGYLIQKNGMTNLKIAAPTPYGNYNLHMAVRNDWPELLDIINKSLKNIQPEQHSQIRNKWLSVRYEHGIDKIDILKWISATILFATCILTVILIWNKKLKKEIIERKQVEKKLQKAADEIKTLSGFIPICAHCKRIRDDKGYWNNLESYIEKHTEALFSHGLCQECQDEFYGKEKWYTKSQKKEID